MGCVLRRTVRVVTMNVMLIIAAILIATSGTAAAQYEQPSNHPVGTILPATLAKSANYTVTDPVVADGYMYHYRLDSTYGPFEAVGTGALRKLVHEIWAIGELKQISGSEAFLKALGNQALKPVEFAKNVITKPGETISGVPKGIGRLFGNASTAVTNTVDPSQESRSKEVLQVGSFKRDYASRYRVDPYSSNGVLQEELDKLAKAAAFGLWTAAVGTMPISGTAGAVMTVTGLGQSFNNVLAAEPPSRIRNINEQKLTEMGIGADLAKRYLDHPHYSPRHDLILVDSLHKLVGVPGRDRYLENALKAEDEVEANFFVNTAQILRGHHETRGRIRGITMFEALTVAQTQSGAALIPFALDYGVWTANADRLSQHLKTAYRAPGFDGRFELWVTGNLSARTKQELQARGFTIVEEAGKRIEIVD
jgi:hypothetical protein